MLKFFFGNKKLKPWICHISLPSGWTCPFAETCLAKADRETGKLTDGEDSEVRCYSASEECIFSTCRKSRWHNLELLRGKTKKQMIKLIEASLPECIILRLHVGGDFFSQRYFDAWLSVALNHPEITFYCYTKSLPFWVKRKSEIPSNFRLTASYGGKHDDLIEKHNLRYCKIVYSVNEAEKMGLPIDTDDSLAQRNSGNFAVMIHGVGKKGSLQAKLHYEKKISARSSLARVQSMLQFSE